MSRLPPGLSQRAAAGYSRPDKEASENLDKLITARKPGLSTDPRSKAEVFPFGIPEVDTLTGGIPKGAVTAVQGPGSSGRTALVLSALSQAAGRDQFCALVDTSDAFDVRTAADAGINLSRLMWVRCSGNVDHALKAAEILLMSGVFPFVALDLAGISSQQAGRINPACWFRFRRAAGNSHAALVVIDRYGAARTVAALALDLENWEATWSEDLRQEGESRSRGSVQSAIPSVANFLCRAKLSIERRKPFIPTNRRARPTFSGLA